MFFDTYSDVSVVWLVGPWVVVVVLAVWLFFAERSCAEWFRRGTLAEFNIQQIKVLVGKMCVGGGYSVSHDFMVEFEKPVITPINSVIAELHSWKSLYNTAIENRDNAQAEAREASAGHEEARRLLTIQEGISADLRKKLLAVFRGSPSEKAAKAVRIVKKAAPIKKIVKVKKSVANKRLSR